MFKKIGIVTALSAAFIFGGAFDSADAHADTNANANVSYKVYYSINGEQVKLNTQNLDQAKIYELVQKVFNQYNINWNNIKLQPQQVQVPEKVEQPVEKQPVQVENQQPSKEVQKPADNKVQQPSKEVQKPVDNKVQQPSKEVQKPANNKVQQPSKEVQQPAKQETTKEQGNQLSQFEQEVVTLTNQERAKYGLAALKVDTALSKVAREKSRDMAVNNYFDHNSPTYGSPFDMMKSFGITYNTAGENIAYGQRTPAEVVNAWMNSEGHRANILNGSFTHIGVGYVENGNYWTQQFIGK
ncbi:CAP domain-containing protein [Oceanobacillus sp. Castelsardo]|uniref:CAP domain-containing protein n=1 Tax=Oceanobacillus sp. Castelsardo TaxID=1851204 RepID=UPI000838D4C3|nr:CAP domain-containing protein [Oceanobacillus sp. Castelsardo]